jgi:transketolase
MHGGMGSAVMEALAWNHPVPVETVAMMDRFGESGEPDELLKEFGLTAKAIEKAVKKVIERK